MKLKIKWLFAMLISAMLIVLLNNGKIVRLIHPHLAAQSFQQSVQYGSFEGKKQKDGNSSLILFPEQKKGEELLAESYSQLVELSADSGYIKNLETKNDPIADQSFELPPDSGYINVKDFGAKGDGITDDTEALRQVFGRNKEDSGGAIRSIYIPNGTYLISNTLEWGDKKKDVRGQSRDGVIIKLKDNCPGFDDPNNPQKVLQIEFGHGGQNFDQRLRNVTVDVGKGNPGAIGIGFHTNNGGGVYNVTVRSSDRDKGGHAGLSLDMAWPGPGLIQNVSIDGFDVGIFIAHDQYSMTFEHLTLTNQRRVGFLNMGNTVAIRDLKSNNRVPAVENQGRTALMTLIEAELSGGDRQRAAIVNHDDGVLFARDITTQGYAKAIDNRAGQQQQVTNQNIDEFVSHEISSLFPSPQQSLHLPVEEPPDIPYGDVSTWVSVTQFGARPDDEEDDGLAIQQAIDSGAETIYLPAGNYRSQQSIRVRGNVRRLFGLNASVVFDVPERPAFIVEDGKYDAVAVEINSNYGNNSSYWLEHASSRSLIFSGGSYINTVPGGKVFIQDYAAPPLVFDRQKVWIRQLNTESYEHNPHVTNKGSDLWILGLKTEKDRTIIGTYNGGRTEVLGGLLYKNQERVGPAPAFICEDSTISLIYRNKGIAYQTQVWEKHDGKSEEFSIENLPASDGRMPLYVGYAKKTS